MRKGFSLTRPSHIARSLAAIASKVPPTWTVEAPSTPVWYEGDEHQIRQVVWNLASNGLRAMPSGGRLVVAARARATRGAGRGEEVELLVHDAGHGIPTEEREGIFQPFRSSFSRGTGLGLAIVHRIVTDAGGAIEVASEVGVGTTFCVRLPARASADHDEAGLKVAV